MPTHPTLPGTCRTTELSEYEQDFVDAEVDAYTRIDADGRGEFQFGYVCGSMTIEFTTRRGKPAVAWLWEGNDEMDAASGRGWAILQPDGSLKGKIFFHSGDGSDFAAVRKQGKL